MRAAGFAQPMISDGQPEAEERGEEAGPDDRAQELRDQLRRDPAFIDRAASRLPFTERQKHVFRTMLGVPEEEFRTRPAIAEAAGMPHFELGAIFGNLGRRFRATEHSLPIDIGLSVAMEFWRADDRAPWQYRLNPVFRKWLSDHPSAIASENGLAP
jgi:hypothetical protein